ncbi:hypothetical protein ACL02U_13240 [Streptomyces sp. MS06]|uniref:hypothetical protein n=1 Tax=Streptomyces sp. MS06 TaxID=3385974 RepID=UPI00399F2886
MARPEIGPKIETRVPEADLATIDGDANKRRIGRAQWLRDAVQRSLPYSTLHGHDHLDSALDEADGWLGACRDVATDRDEPVSDRISRGIAYQECISEMRKHLRHALDAVPVQETRDAYDAEVDGVAGDLTPRQAELWGRASGAEFAARLLDALILTLPVDGVGVRDRAELEDPLMDLGL